MKVKILLFGRLNSITGRKSIELTFEGCECKVEDIKKIVFHKFPELENETFRIVVNQEIGSDSQKVMDGDEIALLPPISGGAFSYLTKEKITPDFVKKESNTKDPTCGSILIFEGKIRKDEEVSNEYENTELHKRYVKEIEYSAYEKMAEKEIEEIVNSAKEKFNLSNIVLKHRIGRLRVGEIAFFVAVFSPHRKEGIGAIDFIIDEVKSKVPIWKKEIYSDGTEKWQEGVMIERLA